MKFAFLFFEFFIPYTVAFWILFGGNRTGDDKEIAHPDWKQFNDLVYSIWTVSLPKISLMGGVSGSLNNRSSFLMT